MRLVLALFGFCVFARTAHAECPSRAAKTIPIARGAVTVDGKLDDATWQGACFVDDFTQKQPRFGIAPSHPIKVAVAIDRGTLYVAARMWSAGPDDISDALTQRDDTQQAERFIVSIDPSHTRRLAYSFAVTARGVRADWIHIDDDEFERDGSWNPVWTAHAERLADGWTAEMAIPLSQLRLPRTPQTGWGINFNWYVPHRQEDVFWISVPLERTAWASMFGELTELPPIDGGLGLELLPYVATRFALDEDPSVSGGDRWLAGLEAGFDVKFRPLPGLTVAATINPDFGQVEADPAFVNLTAYEVQLPERRPFFIENNALFAGAGNYFYSRRIGAEGTRILGALAAGGYIAERTQLGILGAVTDDRDVDGELVAARTGWTAARAEHQVGASLFGASATGVVRGVGGSELEQEVASSAFVGGSDASLRTEDGAYKVDMYAGVSSVQGSAAAIDLVQRSSAHYFQRPGQRYLRYDPTARSLVGWEAGSVVHKRAGTWQGTARLSAESPRFEVNNLGAFSSADDIEAAVDVQHIVTMQTDRVHAWNASGGVLGAWNFGGDRRPVNLHAAGELVLPSFTSIGATAHVTTGGMVDDLTRGGPSMQVGWASAASIGVATGGGTARQLSANLGVHASPTLDRGLVATANAALRITPAVRLDLVPSVTLVETERQYVATVTTAGGGAGTYGARYLFGHLARREAGLELRTTWSLSPDLVLTLYAQPFVSVGRYLRIGELAAARTAEVRWYDTAVRDGASRSIVDGMTGFAIDEPDYRVASLRSTAVLRWELAPGSTLFIVWQQQRGGVPLVPAQPLHEAAPALFTQPALHTLAIKLSYWFG